MLKIINIKFNKIKKLHRNHQSTVKFQTPLMRNRINQNQFQTTMKLKVVRYLFVLYN